LSCARQSVVRRSGRNVSHITASSLVDVAPSAFSTGPRLRPVRQPARVQRQAADVDALARRVVAVGVEHDLLGLDVRVVVGERHRRLVPVEHPRRERADDEVRPLEGLVRGRREVEAPGARLEVHRVERVRVDVAVPAHDVERVAVQHVGLQPVAHARR
jgi:hypothetical protein